MIEIPVKCSCGKVIRFSFKEKPQGFIYTWRCTCAMTAWHSPYYVVRIEDGTVFSTEQIINLSCTGEQPKIDIDGKVVFDPDEKPKPIEGTRFSLLEID